MRPKQAVKSPPPPAARPFPLVRFLVWLLVGAGCIFFLPQCLDRYLAPRFLFVSAALLLALGMLWRDRAAWRMDALGWMLLVWYVWHWVSLSWSFSWSEGVFYTQKVLILFGVYFVFRQMLRRDNAAVWRGLREVVTALTLLVSGVLLGQLALAASEKGLSNDALYDYASGVFGNKSLAADFLFFLLIFNVLCRREQPRRWIFPVSAAVLLGLILVLQVRTVYAATALFGVLFFCSKIFEKTPAEQTLGRHFTPKIKIALFAAALALGLAAILAFGKGSLAERLNPMTYLESTSMNERRFVWYKTDLLNAEHPWWGVGAGSWKFLFPAKNIEGAYRLQEEGIVFTRAHNDYLEIRSEMGIVGGAYFIGIFLLAFGLIVWAIWRGDAARREAHVVLGLGLLGYCVIQYFDFPRERVEMQVLLGVLLALPHPPAPLPLSGGRGQEGEVVLAFGLLFSLLLGFQRVSGEMHNVKLVTAMAKKDYKTMLLEAEKAENTFYEYDGTALPMAWQAGVAEYQMGDYAAAVQSFERAARLNPWSFQVLNNHATALAKAGRYGEAVPIFERVLAINPRYDDGKFNLAWVYMQVNDPAMALAWVEKVDTIRQPATEAARAANRAVLKRKTEMATAIKKRLFAE